VRRVRRPESQTEAASAEWQTEARPGRRHGPPAPHQSAVEEERVAMSVRLIETVQNLKSNKHAYQAMPMRDA
jgi:methylphosphotriester-DNA--protein-cysteine methyltransferase